MADFLENEEIDIENIFMVDSEETEEQLTPEQKEAKDKEKNNITELNEDELFPESVESVGNEDKNKQVEENADDSKKQKNNSTSPNTYSSLALALKNDGILSELDEKEIEAVNDAETLAIAIEKQVESRLEESQKRIKLALDNDVDPSEIRKFEKTIGFLNTVTEEAIKDEGEDGEKLRQQLIYNDYINKGFSPERASKKVQQSFNAGTDIEDAIDALESNKEHYSEAYQELIDEAKTTAENNKKAIKKEAEELQKLILDTETPFGDLKLTKELRKQIYDNVNKPIYKDDKGNYLTAIQKYQSENKKDFMHKLSVIFTLTDGFKDMNKLIKGAAQRESRKSLKEMEHVLATSKMFSDGNLELMGGRDDVESFSGLRLDV